MGFCGSTRLGAKTADLCRKHGISEATFYNWKSKFGGLDVSEAKRLKQLEPNGKGPVSSSDRHTPQRSFGRVVRKTDAAIVEEAVNVPSG